MKRHAASASLADTSSCHRPTMGIIALGHIETVPGTAGDPATYDFPTLIQWLDPSTLQQALRADPALYPTVLAHARELVEAGADMIMTTCGYFTPYQADLSRDLAVPVLTSALIQLPAISHLIGTSKTLVLAANARGVDARCLAGAGMADHRRVVIRGLERPGPFQQQVLAAGGLHDVAAIIAQTVDAVRTALDEVPEIGAVCLECGDLSLCAQALRESTDLPVFDYVTAAEWFYSSQVSTR